MHRRVLARSRAQRIYSDGKCPTVVGQRVDGVTVDPTAGVVAEVPYTADYYFWKAKG